MCFSGRCPEHDICENFNAIDVRELQRKTGWRPGLCFMKEWYRNGAPAGEVFIFTQPDAIVLVHRACPPGSTESRIIELQVPIIWTKCHLGGRHLFRLLRCKAAHLPIPFGIGTGLRSQYRFRAAISCCG
jgi:hypothetical protein